MNLDNIIRRVEDTHIIDFNSLKSVSGDLVFNNIPEIKRTLLKSIEQAFFRNVDNYLIDKVSTDIDRKIGIILRKLSKDKLLKKIILEEDKSNLSIHFVSNFSYENHCYILNDKDERLLKINYSFHAIAKHNKPTFTYTTIDFLQIIELRHKRDSTEYNNHFDHDIIFFKNEIAGNHHVQRMLTYQLSKFNKMKKELGIHIIVNHTQLNLKSLRNNEFHFTLLTRYAMGGPNGSGWAALPQTSMITDNLQQFYLQMDWLWKKQDIQSPIKTMENKRVVQRFLSRKGLQGTYFKLQPKVMTKDMLDKPRLYLNNRVFLKIDDTLNVSKILDENIYTEETQYEPLYKLKDFIYTKDEILLILDMIKL
jgi:hypothetical protein